MADEALGDEPKKEKKKKPMCSPCINCLTNIRSFNRQAKEMYYYRSEMRKVMTEEERVIEDTSLFQPIKIALYIAATSNLYF